MTTASPPLPTQRRRVVRLRALASIDGAAFGAGGADSGEPLPFGIKRVAVAPTAAATAVDVFARAAAGDARQASAKADVFSAYGSGNPVSGLLSLALGQAPRGAASAARLVHGGAGRLSAEPSSEDELGATPTAVRPPTPPSSITPPRKSDPIPIGSPPPPATSAEPCVGALRRAGPQRQQPRENDKGNGGGDAPALDATGSWTTRVTFFRPAAAAPPAPALPPSPAKSDAVGPQRQPQLSSSHGSDSSDEVISGGKSSSGDESGSGDDNERDKRAPSSPRSVFELRRRQQGGAPAARAAAAVDSVAPAPARHAKAAAAALDEPNEDDGWRLRFRRRWRRERLYAAIGVFPLSPPQRDFFGDLGLEGRGSDRRGADALSAAVVGAFDEADASLAWGDGEW